MICLRSSALAFLVLIMNKTRLNVFDTIRQHLMFFLAATLLQFSLCGL